MFGVEEFGYWVLKSEDTLNIVSAELAIGHFINMQKALYQILRFSWLFCFPVSKIDQVLVFVPSIAKFDLTNQR